MGLGRGLSGVLAFKVVGAEVAERRVDPFRVVEALDVVDDGELGGRLRGPGVPMDEFLLELWT